MQASHSIFLLICILTFYKNSLYAQINACISGDCVNGFGTRTWESGDWYVGNFRNSKMQNYGFFYWKNGKSYHGEWLDGKMHGRGELRQSDGLRKTGIWVANELVRIDRPPHTMDERAFQHSKNQLNSFFADRPAALGWVSEQDTVLWGWFLRKLAGEDTHSRIYWQADSAADFRIPSGAEAAHRYPNEVHEGAVWVSEQVAPESLWAGLVFELFNIQNFKDFQQIAEDVKHNRCSEDEYIGRYARLEHRALLKTVDFYQKTWLPHCKKRGLRSQAAYWHTQTPARFEDWIRLYTDKSGYPWHPYRAYYQQLLAYMLERW
jgi:MORN repeat